MKTKTEAFWFVYILECANGKLYTGITTDVRKRFARHVAGKGAKFTMRNKPIKVLAATKCANRSGASKLEWAIKQLTVQKKRAQAKQWECRF